MYVHSVSIKKWRKTTKKSIKTRQKLKIFFAINLISHKIVVQSQRVQNCLVSSLVIWLQGEKSSTDCKNFHIDNLFEQARRQNVDEWNSPATRWNIAGMFKPKPPLSHVLKTSRNFVWLAARDVELPFVRICFIANVHVKEKLRKSSIKKQSKKDEEENWNVLNEIWFVFRQRNIDVH